MGKYVYVHVSVCKTTCFACKENVLCVLHVHENFCISVVCSVRRGLCVYVCVCGCMHPVSLFSIEGQSCDERRMTVAGVTYSIK